METLQEILDKQNACIERCRAIGVKNKDVAKGEWSAEDRQEFDRHAKESAEWKKKYTDVEGDSKRAAFIKDADERANDPASRRRTSADASDTNPDSNGKRKPVEVRWNSCPGNRATERRLVKGGIRATPEYREAFNRYIAGASSERAFRRFKPKAYTANQPTNALRSDDEQQGGYFVTSEDLAEGILRAVDDETFVQKYARMIIVREARSLGLRKRTAKASAWGWGTELQDITENEETSLRFGKRVMEPHYASAMAKISRDLMRVSDQDPESLLMYELGIDGREFLERAYLYGTGDMQPLGLMVADSEGIPTTRDKASASQTAFTFDDWQKAKYSLKPQYRSKARIMLHRDILLEVALLKDTTNQYLWQPSRIVGEPDRILGMEFIESEWMPNTKTAGLYYALIGDFSWYYIAFALNIEMQRLNELSARTNQIEYHLRMKLDAQPMMEEAFTRLAYAP